jgi:heptaprenyl diphosphate synthase
MMSKTNKMVLMGILVSQALILHLIERMIPVPVPVPGIKLGLANAISLMAIVFFGTKEALVVVALRTFLGSVFGGGVSAFIYSLIGGCVSALAMAIMYKRFRNLFSLPAISVVGAIFHNVGQILVEIGRAGNVSLSALAERMDLDKSTTSRTVDQLVRQGYAHRITDDNNRRFVLISLTGKGREEYLGIETSMDDYFERLFLCIPKEKRNQVIESMSLLLEAVRKN